MVRVFFQPSYFGSVWESKKGKTKGVTKGKITSDKRLQIFGMIKYGSYLAFNSDHNWIQNLHLPFPFLQAHQGSRFTRENMNYYRFTNSYLLSINRIFLSIFCSKSYDL